VRVGRHVAPDVAADRRVLDLDHLGPEVGEVQRPERTGAELLDGHDADVLQWLHAVRERAANAVAQSPASIGVLACGKMSSSSGAPRLYT
jgi:hypothetical protein